MRSADIKTHRTDGSSDIDDDYRLARVRAAMQGTMYLAPRIMLLHDHKGHLHVFHFETLHRDEREFIRQAWVLNCEPAENVTFIGLGDGNAREIG